MDIDLMSIEDLMALVRVQDDYIKKLEEMRNDDAELSLEQAASILELTKKG